MLTVNSSVSAPYIPCEAVALGASRPHNPVTGHLGVGGPGRRLAEARQAAEAVEPAADRAWALATLIPTPQVQAADRLSLFDAVMAATSDPSLARTRSWILARLAGRMPRQVSQELVSAMRRSLCDFADLRALPVAAAYLPPQYVRQLSHDLRTKATELEDPQDRLTVMGAALLQ